MKVVILASGSKGNATYIETNKTKLLIDCGISFVQIKSRLKNQGINLNSLDAIFISHEHTDHINSLASVLAKTHATLYIKEETFNAANKKLRNSLLLYPKKFINADTKYIINDVFAVPIELSHDASNCFGYLIKELDTNNNNTFASITDTGFIPNKYYKILSTINTILIESNHDVEMLMNSGRPWILIQRILSDKGHMSNEQCVNELTKFLSANNKNIILGHISEECNDYDLALNYCKEKLNNNDLSISVAYQYVEHSLITIGDKCSD